MPKVTSVEPQKKNPRRFNIFFDGVFAFGADEDLVVERRLVVGKQLDNPGLERLLFEAEVGKLMERMYGLFGRRQRSEKEVRDYFRIKNYELRIKGKEERSQLVIDAVINVLKKKGLINDEEFAKAWVEARSRKKGWRAIQAELFQKGVDRETIQEVISDKRQGTSEESTANALLEKRIQRWKHIPKLEFKKKAYEFLMRRGFEYDVVKEVVEKFLRQK